jgi:acyl carrier protein
MNASVRDIKEKIKNYLIEELFEVGKEDVLTDSTPLITGGLLDSISAIKLVIFLEKQFHIEFQPGDVDRDNLDTIALIADFVSSKLIK